MKKEDNMIIFQTLANLKFLDDFVVALNDEGLSKQTLADFYRKWLQDIEWTEQSTEEYSLMNQGVILTSLYGTIVYPKEKFYNEIPETPLTGPDQRTTNFKVQMGVHEVHKFIYSLNRGLIKGEWD